MTSNALLNNSERTFQDIHDQMMKIVKKGTQEAIDEAGSIATELLTHPELPQLIRIRSHIVLSYGQHDYLSHARSAAELVEDGTQRFGSGDTKDEQDALKILKLETQYVLDLAEADDKARQAQLAEWKEEGALVLEPGEEAPPGYEAKERKYHGNRPNREGKSYNGRITQANLTRLQTTSSILLHPPVKEVQERSEAETFCTWTRRLVTLLPKGPMKLDFQSAAFTRRITDRYIGKSGHLLQPLFRSRQNHI
jgi:hypothetical protein